MTTDTSTRLDDVDLEVVGSLVQAVRDDATRGCAVPADVTLV